MLTREVLIYEKKKLEKERKIIENKSNTQKKNKLVTLPSNYNL